MIAGRAGDTVTYQVTYLEMTQRPQRSAPELPPGFSLVRAIDPPVWYFLALYDAVGRDYEWTDRFDQAETDPKALQDFVRDPNVALWTGIANGWPQGFFQLDWRQPGSCDLAYFGLVPQAIGRGWGPILLAHAINAAWTRPETRRLTVNTCELDHPSALNHYLRAGFRAVRKVRKTRVLQYDRQASARK